MWQCLSGMISRPQNLGTSCPSEVKHLHSAEAAGKAVEPFPDLPGI